MKKLSITILLIIASIIVIFYIQSNKKVHSFTDAKRMTHEQISLDILKQSVGEKGGSVVSGFGLFQNLSLLYWGASDKAKTEIEHLFNTDSNTFDVELIDKFLVFAKQINNTKVMQSVNLILHNKETSLSPNYIEKATKYALLKETHLDPEKLATEINQWVTEKTNHKIMKVVDGNELSFQTLLTIISATVYENTWNVPFRKWTPRERIAFTSSPTRTENIEIMSTSSAKIRYNSDSNYAYISIPMKENFYFEAILPHQYLTAQALIAQFSHADLTRLREIKRHTEPLETQVQLPVFSTEKTIHLIPILQSLGCNAIFNPNPQGNFNAMFNTPQSDAFIHLFRQVNHFSIDETGVKAASVTITAPCQKCAVEENQFKADHPFIYTIRYQKDNTAFTFFFGVMDI